MGDARNLGPNTEARFALAFADEVMLTAQATAKLLGLDVDTLRQMTQGGLIRAVRRGKVAAYTEADLRSFLTDCPAPCPPAPKPKTRMQSRPGKVVAFSGRRGAASHERL